MHSDKEDEVEEELGSSPGVHFSSLFQGFRLRGRAQKAVYICHIYIQDRSFNNFENDTMKLSVNKAKTDWF